MARRIGRGLFRRRRRGDADPGATPDDSLYPDEPISTEPFTAIGGETEEWSDEEREATSDRSEQAEPGGERAAATESAGGERVAKGPADPEHPDRREAGGEGQAAAQQAEIRAVDEILALESDLERAKQEAAGEIETLRERLQVAEQGAQAAAAIEAGVDPAEVRREIGAALEGQAREDLEQRRGELETRLRAELEGEAEDRLAKLQADADERVRTEVGIARTAAEDHFREALTERERELEGERTAKAKLIEDSERRLTEIERKAGEAAARVSAAEARLAEKEANVRRDAEAELERERQRIGADAAGEAGRRVATLEAELQNARVDGERRVADLEGRLKLAEASAGQEAEELRLAAAAWVRGQADSLRKQGAASGTSEEESARDERFEAAASRIDAAAARADAAAERAAPDPEASAEEGDTQSWDVGKPDERS